MAAVFFLAEEILRERGPREVRHPAESSSSKDHKSTFRLSEESIVQIVNEYHLNRQYFHPDCRRNVSHNMVQTFLEYLSGKFFAISFGL